MIKKIIALSILIITVIVSIYIYINVVKTDTSNATQGNFEDAIYVLSGTRQVCSLDRVNHKLLSTQKVYACANIEAVGNNKIYAPIRGDDRKAGEVISVIQNGKELKKIKMTYDFPEMIRYNPYNKKAYVSHVTKLTYHNENCITVVDTANDKEEYNIMYDNQIFDMVFTKDNKMIASTQNINSIPSRLSVFDLSDNTLIKEVPTEIKMCSLQIADNELIYAVSDMSEKPIVYVYDWKNEKVNTIQLKYKYPNGVHKGVLDGKQYIFITHFNIDDRSGNEISVIDPETNICVKEITGVKSPLDIIVDKDDIFVASWFNNIYIIKDFKIDSKIEIGLPITITKAFE